MDPHLTVSEIMELAASFEAQDQEPFAEFARKHLAKSKSFHEVSESRIQAMLLERLAKNDGELMEALMRRRANVASSPFHTRKAPETPGDLTARSGPQERETKAGRIQRLLPALRPRSLKLRYPPDMARGGDASATLGLEDLWDLCTQETHSPFYYPRWTGDLSAQCPHPSDRGWWWTQAYPDADKVTFIAKFRGDGVSDEDYCAHMATFWWYFVAERSETLDAWINFSLRGPCAYRTNGGDVALWILPSLIVKKGWGADWSNLQTVFQQERWINIWLATYDGPFVDGGVPQGVIDQNFHPVPDDTFRLDVTAGERYIVSVNVQIALLNTRDGVIMLGDYSGSWPHMTFNTCALKGDCVMCRCY